MIRFLLLCSALSLVAAPTARAQKAIAEPLAQRRTSLEVGSRAWCELGVEQAGAEIQFDTRAAQVTGDLVAAAARQHGHADAELAARELSLLAASMREGVSAHPLLAEHEHGAPTGAPSLLASYHCARAARAWLADQPALQLSHTLAGLRAARESGDDALILLALWSLRPITEAEVPAYDQELHREIERRSRSERAKRFEAWRLLDEFWRRRGALAPGEVASALAKAHAVARELGDQRTECAALWEQAQAASDAGRREEALALLARARELAERSGLRREQLIALELSARERQERGDVAGAGADLEAAWALAESSGFVDRVTELRHARLQIATLEGREDAVLRENAALAELRREQLKRYAGVEAVASELLSGEIARAELERRTGEAAAAAERDADRRLTQFLAAMAGVLAVGGALAWLGQRKLARANAQLAEQARRAEAEHRSRLEAEARLRQLERADSLGLVASGVAHDFNNLMVGVIGNADLLREHETDPRRRAQLDVICAAGERAARLCAQLQAYAAEPASLEVARFDTREWAAEFAPVLSAAAGPKIAVEFEEVDAFKLDAGRPQLEQALLNLVVNARDARASRATVRIVRTASRPADVASGVVSGEWIDSAYACIEVRDDGEGMSRDLLERVFDPFFTTRFPGRGLGLAVVLGAVRQHRGVVCASSTPGAGSCFRLYLPNTAQADSALVLPHNASVGVRAPSAPLCVLAVDDETDVREFVRTALEARGHRVRLASDVATALEQLAACAGEQRLVALVDLTLAVSDGREVVLALRARAPGLAVVLMSGQSAQNLADTALAVGAQGRLAKPFGVVALERALGAALEAAPNAASNAATPTAAQRAPERSAAV